MASKTTRLKPLNDRKCTVEGCCNTGEIRQGYCNKHYRRWRRHGDPLGGGPEQDRTKWIAETVTENVCRIDGCNRSLKAQGLCSAHYGRWQRYGDPLGGGPERKPAADQVKIKCNADGCEKSAVTRGMCPAHYSRWRKGNEWNTPLTRQNISKAQTMNNGYIFFTDYEHPQSVSSKNGKVLVHRAVMSEILGRPLTRQETVHHKDGNRANNDPDNLELFTSNHPSGQRVEELVEWAEQIIEKYGDYIKRKKEISNVKR